MILKRLRYFGLFKKSFLFSFTFLPFMPALYIQKIFFGIMEINTPDARIKQCKSEKVPLRILKAYSGRMSSFGKTRHLGYLKSFFLCPSDLKIVFIPSSFRYEFYRLLHRTQFLYFPNLYHLQSVLTAR